MLSHINNQLDADFDLENFSHKAVYNETKSRIEMHLECNNSHQVNINDNVYSFVSGETIHTENSYKNSIDEFQNLAEQAGFSPVKVWSDNESLFSVHYLTAV